MSEFKGLEVNDVLGLSQPLAKLIESISGGIGKLYEPTHIRRLAKAKAEELGVISNALTENITLPTKYLNGSINIDTTDVNELVKRAQNRFLFQEMQKQQNIDAVVAGAYNELEQETEVSAETVDKDWIIRFFNSVEDISDENLQKLWAKLLAGEIKQPKSYSMRTLDVLHNISREEALLFEEICKYRIIDTGVNFIPNTEDFMKMCDLQYGDIMHLDECALVNSQNFITLENNVPTNNNLMFRNSKIAIFARSISGKNEKLILKVYPFTGAGKEIAQLLDYEIDNDCLLEFVRILLKTKRKEIAITAHHILSIIDEGIKYEGKDLLEI